MIKAEIHLIPLPTSTCNIYNVFEPLVCGLNGIWVHPYTVTPPAKLTPVFGNSGHLWSENDVIRSCFEAEIHIRPLQTSIVNIYKVFEPLVCCLKAICVHLYTMPPARFAPDLGIQVCLWIVNDVITSWLRLRSTSYHFPHPHATYTTCLSHWYAVSMAFGCTLILLHHRPSWPQFLGIQVTCGVKMMS